MPAKTWKLIGFGAPNQIRGSQRQLNITPRELGTVGSWHVLGHALDDGVRAGVDLVEINNGALTYEVIPTRGMSVWRARLSGDREVPTIGWQSPVRGPVHPGFVDLGEPSGLGWLDGFDELLVRCGLESNGAPDFDETTGRLKYPLHGRIANKPAHELELTIDSDKQEMALRGVVEETRFHFLKLRMISTITTKFGGSSFSVRDEVENFSASPATMQMLYHINFGLPLLDGGSRVVAPVQKLVPRNPRAAAGIKTWDSYSAPEPGFEEQVYFFELLAAANGQTRTLLKNAHATRGVSLVFNKQQLPYFTVWKNTTGATDGYVTGLEPGTNFPNPRTFETAKNRFVKLAPGQKAAFDLTLDVHGSAVEVAASEAEIAKLQSGQKPTIHDQPQADWCA